MDSDDTRLRAALRRSLEIVGDAAEPAPAFDELGAPAGPGGDERFHRSRRGLAIAGALVATVALVGGLLVVRSETDDGTRIGGVDTIPAAPATTGAIATVPDSTVATTIGSTVPPSTVPPTTVPPTTVQPTAEAGSLLTVEEVRTKQAEALRELPGFTATVTKSVVDPVSGEPIGGDGAGVAARRRIGLGRPRRARLGIVRSGDTHRRRCVRPARRHDGLPGDRRPVRRLAAPQHPGRARPDPVGAGPAGRSGRGILDGCDRDDVRGTPGVGDHRRPDVRRAVLRPLQPRSPGREDRADRGAHDRPGDGNRDPQVDDDHAGEPAATAVGSS